eukprot:scaffold7_cov378-Prasinococcus_capsulatus_cf.AAC.15
MNESRVAVSESPPDSATYSEVDGDTCKVGEQQLPRSITEEDQSDRRGQELNTLREAYKTLTGKTTDATSVVWLVRKVKQLSQAQTGDDSENDVTLSPQQWNDVRVDGSSPTTTSPQCDIRVSAVFCSPCFPKLLAALAFR